MKKIFLVLISPLFIFAATNSGSILLYNDTPFILTATIQASDGTYLGQFTIQPGQQSNFTQNLSPTRYTPPGTPQVSLTPYTVIWQCPSQDFYSMSHTVSPGSLVRANDCPGNHFCSPKKKESGEKPASVVQEKKSSQKRNNS